MSEFIGSRISLISKSDIKYVGTLHEINSENHTVALENVRSYGTEGRKGTPAEEIEANDHVYEYIVFRGSDVKDLSIIGNAGPQKQQQAVPDDPAILGSARPAPPQQQQPPQQPQQAPPQDQNQFRGPQPPFPQHPPPPHFGGYQGPPPPNQFQGQPRFQGPGGPHGFPGSPGAVPGYGFQPPPPPGYGFNGPPPPPGHGFPPPFPPGQGHPHPQFGSPGPQQMDQPRGPQQQGPGQQAQAPVSSKQGTPQPQQDLGALQQPPQGGAKPVEMSATPGPSADLQAGAPPPPVASKPTPAAATAPPTAPPQPLQKPQQGPQRAAHNRVAVPLPAQQRPAAAAAAAAPAPPAPVAQPKSFADATQAATAAVAAAMAKMENNKSPQQTDGATDNLTQKVQQMRIQDQRQRGNTRGTRSRGNGPRGGRGNAIEVPKEDFDFESSNAKFNKQELVKEAIATGSPAGEASDPIATVPAVNGRAEKDDEVIIPPAEKGYDKKSSFFDNISSDLKDRVEQAQSEIGFDGRAMRTQERSKNMETFGQSNIEGGGYRGGFRGRGRGFQGGYRGRGNYRGRGGYGGFDARGGARGAPRGGGEGVAAGSGLPS